MLFKQFQRGVTRGGKNKNKTYTHTSIIETVKREDWSGKITLFSPDTYCTLLYLITCQIENTVAFQNKSKVHLIIIFIYGFKTHFNKYFSSFGRFFFFYFTKTYSERKNRNNTGLKVSGVNTGQHTHCRSTVIQNLKYLYTVSTSLWQVQTTLQLFK